MTEPTTLYTRTDLENPERRFPQTLMMVPQRSDIPKAMVQHYTAHNRAVQEFAKLRVGAMSNTKQCELAILALLAGVEEFTANTPQDPYTAEHVIRPILAAIGDALNLDLGRLDGGTLAHWVSVMAGRWDLNPDLL